MTARDTIGKRIEERFKGDATARALELSRFILENPNTLGHWDSDAPETNWTRSDQAIELAEMVVAIESKALVA